MERPLSPDREEDSGGPDLLRLTLRGSDSALYEATGVPRDMLVRDLADTFYDMVEEYASSPEVILRRQNPDHLVVDLLDPEIGPTRLDPDATLRDLDIQDGAVLSISGRVLAGGQFPPNILLFISEAIASGIAGNAAYELLKSAFRTIGVRWRKEGQSLYRHEAVELTRACLCLKFDIEEPARLQLLSADPVTAKFNGAILQDLRTQKRSNRRKADYWRCTYNVQEEGLPSIVAILIGIPHIEPSPDYSIMFLLPD